MPLRIEGPSGNVAETTDSKRLKVALNSEADETIAENRVALVAIADVGQVVVGGRVQDLELTEDYSLRVGQDHLLFDDNFVGSALNSNLWKTVNSTMTAAVSNGFLSLNSGDSVTSGHYVNVSSYKVHPLKGSAVHYAQARIRTVNCRQLNKVMEFGLAYALTNAAITDGAVFRWAADGKLYGVLVNNGVEEIQALNTYGDPLGDDETHFYYVTLTYSAAEFWIDDIMHARIDHPIAWDSAVRSGSLPTLMRQYNSGTPALAARLEVAETQVIQGGLHPSRPVATALTQMGQHGLQGQTGFSSLGQTAQWANSAAPSAATLSNTTPSYATLGGLFTFDVPNGAETDYALFGYPVPAGSVGLTGKQFVCTGIRIDAVNTVINNATPVIVLWGAGFGATAASLATSDSASGKGPRRTPLGVQVWAAAAAIGSVPPAIDVDFSAPAVVNPGEYLHVIARIISGSATAPATIRGSAQIRGYWE